MDQIALFNAALNEFDRLEIVAASTESKFEAAYYKNKARLPGGAMLGGTEEEGKAFLKEARDRLIEISWKK